MQMRRVGCCAVLVYLACSAFGQKPVEAPALGNEGPAAVHKGPVTINVEVTDKAGHPVTGLQQADFSVTDNKQPAAIGSFEAHETSSSAPQVALLLMDDVNANFSSVSVERTQIGNFLRSQQGHLPIPVSFAFLTDKGVQGMSAPSTDGNAIASELQQEQGALREIGRSAGFYGGEERLQISLTAVQALAQHFAGIPGRKLVLWISPGWPIFDNPNVIISEQQRRNFFNAIVGFSDALRGVQIVLYAVDPLGTGDAATMRTFLWENYLKPVRKPNQADPGDLALQVLATQSGGKVLSGSNDVAGELAKCVEDSSAWYTLSFDPQASDAANTWHDIQVKVDKPGLTVRTRNGYYSQP